MSSNNNEGRGRAIQFSTRLTNDKPFQSNSTRTVDNWMSNKRIDRHYKINGGKTKLIIKQGDITNTKVDAIVNAANEHMTGGAGVDGMIHRAAGPQLRDECYLHRQVEPGVRLPTGRSRILLSYNLASNTNYIINTAGPIYNSYDKEKCEDDLKSCYKTALALANLYDLKSIAFPAISCGIFGYPVDKGAETALKISDQYADQLSEVMFILFDGHIYDVWFKKATDLGYSLWDPPQKSIVKPETEDAQSDDDDVVTHSTGQSASEKANPSAKTFRRLEIVEAPSPLSNSQQTQDMQDPEEDKSKETTLLKQSTAEIADVQSQIDKTEDKDKSQSQSSSSQTGATGENSVDPAAAATEPETGTETNAKPTIS